MDLPVGEFAHPIGLHPSCPLERRIRTENKSLMKLAEDLGVPFSAAKVIHDHAMSDMAPWLKLREAAEGAEKFIAGRVSWPDGANIKAELRAAIEAVKEK